MNEFNSIHYELIFNWNYIYIALLLIVNKLRRFMEIIEYMLKKTIDGKALNQSKNGNFIN